MRTYALLIMSMGLGLTLVGCGDSGDSGNGGSGGSSTATVSGTVFAASSVGDSTELDGATVTVVGTSTTATSGPNGAFSLEAPLGTRMFRTTAPDAWGELLTEQVPAGGINTFETEVVPDTLVAEVEDELMETIDPTKGMVIVEFDANVAVGGETADLGANYDFAFVFNAAEEPVSSNVLIAGGDTIVLFANVDIGTDVMPTATGASGGACSLAFPGTSFPSEPKVFTVVDVAPCP